MYHKMHDGPTYLPTGPRYYQPPAPKPRATLAALQWAAERANQSYGVFTLNLTPEDETRIQEEYTAWRNEKETPHAER